ncbi:MAG: sodium:proton antiporter [Gammaproteobacteria bacterium]|nr:MAG: sodium:proton antiporter [Gammaproteobacteria bacterium]
MEVPVNCILSLVLLCFSITVPVFASDTGVVDNLSMTGSGLAILSLIIFAVAYALVVAEEFIDLHKSKPVMFAAGLIWIMVAILARQNKHGKELIDHAINHDLLEYGALCLFLLTAMTYINAMTDRKVFDALKEWLIKRGFSYRKLFWITGFLAFFISPIADNLTIALLMGAVVLAVGYDNPKFVSLAFIGIVVGANSGGAFSPFGDITTLMVWQSGNIDFFGFFALFIPSLVSYLVPALLISLAVPQETPALSGKEIVVLRGGFVICFLFISTIATAVSFEKVLHLPPFLGMMMGLSYLFLFSYYLKQSRSKILDTGPEFSAFEQVARVEWGTLFFFFGVIFCVGGLGIIGYLSYVSEALYGGLGVTAANIIAGVLSAVVDNIPVMFAILTMNPEMNHYQWLLVTMTVGVGGSLLSVGSAAGVALMGQSNGMYTFFSHIKWSWAIALGYAASIYTHYLINA